MVDARPLRVPAYRRLWLASVVTSVGGSFSVIVIPTLLFTLTGSSATVGVASSISLVTLIISALGGGVLADRVDRRRVLLVTTTVLGLVYALFWLRGVIGIDSVGPLLILVGVQGLSFGANMTTLGAVVPRLVPGELLAAANSLSSLVRQVGVIVGPMLAGLLLPVIGLNTLFLLDALALLTVLVAVHRLPAIQPASGQRAGRLGLSAIGGGFAYLCRHPVLVAVMAVDLSAMVFGMPVALFPQVAEQTFAGPPGGGLALGALFAAYPVGVFATGLVSGIFTRSTRHGALLIGASLGWGVTVIGFGLSRSLWLGLGFLVLGGAFNFVLSTFRNAITQSYADDEMLGRTQGAVTVVLVGGPQLANVLHGLGGAVVGTTWAISGGGILVVVAVAVIATVTPGLRQYRPVQRGLAPS
jgi:MFS family permease